MELRSTHSHQPRSAARAGWLAGAVLLVTTACSDSRLEKLSAGISRDSALAIINEGASGDSLARVYRQDAYLLENKTGNVHQANVLFYHRKGVKAADDSTLTRSETTPIVVIDGKVTGWGWTYFDSLSTANNIPLAPAK